MITGLMIGDYGAFVFQSIPRISSKQIAPPSIQRVTVNPKNGRTEYVFVNLGVLYPDTARPASELSFEEVMASHRGWSKQVWKPEAQVDSSESRAVSYKHDEPSAILDATDEQLPESVTSSHEPVILDENGIAKDTNRESKARRMKIKEINETQISKSRIRDLTIAKLIMNS